MLFKIPGRMDVLLLEFMASGGPFEPAYGPSLPHSLSGSAWFFTTNPHCLLNQAGWYFGPAGAAGINPGVSESGLKPAGEGNNKGWGAK
jgi:hypothetical protein